MLLTGQKYIFLPRERRDRYHMILKTLNNLWAYDL